MNDSITHKSPAGIVNADPTRWNRRTWTAAALIVAVASLCRFYAAIGDFWLDEIVSWVMIFHTNPVESGWQILLIQQETNQFLSTWILYLFGPDAHWIWYRVPAVLAGIGTVALAGLIAGQRGKVEALTALLLVGGSYPLIHYASEARGYAYVLFFSFLSFYVAERSFRSRRVAWDYLFSMCAVIGFLAQLLYLYCYASIAVWGLWRMWREGRSWQAIIAKTFRWHALPVLLMTGLYIVTIRHMQGVGGPILNWGDVIATTLSLAVGGPAEGILAFVVAVGVGLALIAGLWMLGKDDPDEWLFYLCVGCVLPLTLILVLQRQEVYLRYFLISVAFQLLLLSHVLARVLSIQRIGKPVYALIVIAFLAGNTMHTARLFQHGPGSYREAILLMEEQTTGPNITVGSDHDYRNGYVLEFYRRRLPLTKEIVYFPTGRWPRSGPEWVLRHSLETDHQAEPSITDRNGNTYDLVREYPYAGLSGWHWSIYRNTKRGL